MRITVVQVSVVLISLLGCARPTRTGQPLPQPPVSVTPVPAPGVQASQSWSFIYQAGIAPYRITRTATIESIADSISPMVSDSSANIAHEVLALERIGDTIQFVLTVDTFATAAPERAGNPRAEVLPVEIKGQMTRDSLIFTRDSADIRCNPIASAAISDLHNLLVRFPAELISGMAWQDSVGFQGCQASIPTTVHITRSFRVMGPAPDTESDVVAVERSDSIHAHGEGAQQQHHVVLDATGSGTAVYYLSISDGRVLRASSDQGLDLTVTTSENTGRFRQKLKQELTLIR